jgi:hypothetical protein
MSQVPIQENTGDFRLLDRRCIEAIKSYGKLSVIQKEGLAGLIITRGKSLFFILFIIRYAMIHSLIEIQTRLQIRYGSKSGHFAKLWRLCAPSDFCIIKKKWIN